MQQKNGADDIKSDLKSTDLSAVFGAEYSFPMGINVTASYQAGLSNINASKSSGTVKNSAFSVTIGYTFGKK